MSHTVHLFSVILVLNWPEAPYFLMAHGQVTFVSDIPKKYGMVLATARMGSYGLRKYVSQLGVIYISRFVFLKGMD